MSQLSAVGTVIAGQVEDILLRVSRSIGTIIPQCTVEERARDEMAITEHPIQTGASITDHAYSMPSIVTARYGWSNSGAVFDLNSGGLVTSDPQSIYDQLLTLQKSRQPFTLTTGKQSYPNMLIGILEQTTDKRTENILMVSITFRQILIVDIQDAQLQTTNMANPAATAPVTNSGTVQPKPVSTSILSTTTSLFGFGS